MKLTRRNLFELGALAAGGLPIAGPAIGAVRPRVIFFDSRSKASRQLASARNGRLIDVAQTAVNLWRGIQQVPAGAKVSAYTYWSDFISIRGQLEGVGLRLTHIEPRGDLMEWSMG